MVFKFYVMILLMKTPHPNFIPILPTLGILRHWIGRSKNGKKNN